jgi:hypothetical protein
MKNFILFTTLFVYSVVPAKSQTPENQIIIDPEIVYSLPKTKFCIDVEIEKTTQKPGVFYRYSERYLATNKVIFENKVTFQLKNIKVKTITLPDLNRTYSFVPSNVQQTTYLSVNSLGILCGVNVACQSEKDVIQTAEKPFEENSKPDALLPLGEEYMMAGSEAKLAEGVAKQIYRIRERRLSLLTADTDKLPADGASFKTMLDNLNKMEHDLTELFVGKTIIESQTKTINIIPTATVNNSVLFRLSLLKGIVNADDLSGNPYYINIISSPTNKLTIDSKPKIIDSRSKQDYPALYYILPAWTQVSIGDGITTLYKNDFIVPQLGQILSLPESLFKQPHIKVRFDSQTGRLLNIE